MNYQNALNTSDSGVKNIPSSFSINPDFFNQRVGRIKIKIDGLTNEYISNNEKAEQTSEKSSSLNSNNYKIKHYQHINVDKFDQHLKQRIKNIYNEIHELQTVCNQDETKVQTNTFQLRYFTKDLSKQQKRLYKIVPPPIMSQLQASKKQPYKKSGLQFKNIVNDGEQKPQPKVQKRQTDVLNQAQQQITEQFKKRRVFRQDQKYYEDKEKQCKCQII